MSSEGELDLTDGEKKRIVGVERKRRDREISDLKKVLDSVEGRRFVWRLLSEAGVFHGSFNANALVMAFHEGKRDLGILLIGEINGHAPHRYVQMQNEWSSDQKSEKASERKADAS